MTPEGKVKAKITACLRGLGVFYFLPIASPIYGRRGIPDIVVCIKGRFVGIEVKAGKNKLTELQEEMGKRLEYSGGMFLTVNEETLDTSLFVLKKLAGATA